MAPGREWWLGLLLGWYLLCLASCADNGTEDNAAVTQTTTEPTMIELGLRLAPKGLNLAGLSPVDVDQVIRGSYLVNGAATVRNVIPRIRATWLAAWNSLCLPCRPTYKASPQCYRGM